MPRYIHKHTNARTHRHTHTRTNTYILLVGKRRVGQGLRKQLPLAKHDTGLIIPAETLPVGIVCSYPISPLHPTLSPTSHVRPSFCLTSPLHPIFSSISLYIRHSLQPLFTPDSLYHQLSFTSINGLCLAPPLHPTVSLQHLRYIRHSLPPLFTSDIFSHLSTYDNLSHLPFTSHGLFHLSFTSDSLSLSLISPYNRESLPYLPYIRHSLLPLLYIRQSLSLTAPF